MSSVRVELTGETEKLLERLAHLRNMDIRGAMNGIAEGLRTSTIERFHEERTPEGQKWETSIRAQKGGKTLTETAQLKNSIRAEVSEGGLAVGTNDIRAATHQFGDTRTIRAKNGKYLTFKVNGEWRRVESVTINIPARPFLGISEEDEQEIKEALEELLEE